MTILISDFCPLMPSKGTTSQMRYCIKKEIFLHPSHSDTHALLLQLDHNEMMEAGVSHKLRLWVDNYGYALVQLADELQGFIPEPEVDDITPLEGSIRGGTRVTVTG